MSATRIHIYPVNPQTRKSSHFTGKKIPCWCNPEIKQVCPEADESGTCVPDCWKCGGRSLVKPYCEESTTLIIHNEDDKPCYPDMPDEALAAK